MYEKNFLDDLTIFISFPNENTNDQINIIIGIAKIIIINSFTYQILKC